MGDRTAIDLELHGRGGWRSEPQQRGGAALPRRPAPVQRGVVARERLEARRKTAECDELAAAFGLLQRRPGGVEAGSVDLGGGDARLEAGGHGPEAAGDDPRDLREAQMDLVQDLPHGPGGSEERLELVAPRDGEARGEGGAPAPVELRDRVAERALQAGAAGRRQGTGRGGVADERDVTRGHFMSLVLNVTNYVINYLSDDNCQRGGGRLAGSEQPISRRVDNYRHLSSL